MTSFKKSSSSTVSVWLNASRLCTLSGRNFRELSASEKKPAAPCIHEIFFKTKNVRRKSEAPLKRWIPCLWFLSSAIDTSDLDAKRVFDVDRDFRSNFFGFAAFASAMWLSCCFFSCSCCRLITFSRMKSRFGGFSVGSDKRPTEWAQISGCSLKMYASIDFSTASIGPQQLRQENWGVEQLRKFGANMNGHGVESGVAHTCSWKYSS